jgi:predicted lactoylglutathione lyase
MSKKQVFINIPVSDLIKSTQFYEALGFTKNAMFSNDQTGNALQWSEDIVFMLLTHDFFKTFIKDKEVADAKTTAGLIVALNLDSKEAVDKFAETAKANGGDYYRVVGPGTEDFMYGYEVLDLDGNILEPLFMDVSKFHQ